MGHCRTDLVEKALLMNVPRTGDVPRREPASPAASAHLVGTLVAVGAVDRITALVGVRSVEEEGHLAVERIADRIVVAEVLGTLLEGQIIVVGLHAVAVLETPAAEPRVVAGCGGWCCFVTDIPP